MTLVTPPSFTSPLPLSARFNYAPKGTNVHSYVLGTTGHAFIAHAWMALRRMSFARLESRAYSTNYGTGLTEWRRGTSFNTALTGGRGTRWDNDFNRALWAWMFMQWNAQTVRFREPSAFDQFFGGATSNERDGWISALNAIEWCEVNQIVSREAMMLACLLVADSLGLVDNVTTPRASLDDGTVLLRYNTDPPLPATADRDPGNQLKTWPRGGSPGAGAYLTDRPQGPAQAGGDETSPPVPSDHERDPRGPLGPPGGLSSIASLAITLTAAIGGILLVGGVGIMAMADEG